jgi:hypothetical protein
VVVVVVEVAAVPVVVVAPATVVVVVVVGVPKGKLLAGKVDVGGLDAVGVFTAPTGLVNR